MIKLDPRTKLIIVFLISTAAIVIKEIEFLLILLLITIITCRLLSISLFGAIKRLRKLVIFFLTLALIQSLFTSGGEIIFKVGNLRILTTEGIISGISIIIRMSIIICSALIISSSPTMKVIYGLIAMKIPYEIAFMVLIAIKFLPIFRDEFVDSLIAIQLSGVDIKKTPLKQKLTYYSYIMTPSIIKALNRARYISISMECRGFRANNNRTSYCKLHMTGMDYVALFIGLLSVFLVMFLHYSINIG